jgi:hypothetical protein
MNKAMFWVGIVIIVITAVLLLTVKEELSLGAMGGNGIVLIAASEYRPLKGKK